MIQNPSAHQLGFGNKPWLTIEWWLVVAAMVITAIDFSTIGLASQGGTDGIKWLFRAVVWYLPLAVLMPRWSVTFQALRLPPSSWLILWAGWSPISVLWAAQPIQALLLGVATLSLAMLGTWYVMVFGWEWFATAATVGLVTVVGAGLLLDVASGLIMTERSAGLSFGPTTQGRFAALGLVLTAGLVARRSPGRFVWLFSLGVFSIAIWFTETRTAMGAAIVGLLYGGLHRLPPLYRRVFLLLFSLAVLAMIIGLGSASTTVSDLNSRNDPTSFSGRSEVWPIAIEYVSERPILGYGMGNEGALFEIAYNAGRLNFAAGTSHNVAVTTLLGGGIVGFVLFHTALLSAFARRKQVDPWVFAIVPVFIICGLTEAIINIPSISLIILAAAYAATARSSTLGHRLRQSPLTARNVEVGQPPEAPASPTR